MILLNKLFQSIGCMLLVFSVPAQRNILTSELTRVGVDKLEIVSKKFQPFPARTERQVWNNIPLPVRNAVIQDASKYLNYTWPSLPASLFQEFSQSGNRSHYETAYFSRRQALSSLVLAECVENEGRYLKDIVNGIWLICEESYWGVPAHLYLQKSNIGLPDVSEPTVDLFTAETAALLAWTYYFLQERLDSVSLLINQRILAETERRFLTPNLLRTDFWWMGFGERIPNNWNPWIASNWIACVLITEKDPERKKKAFQKIMECLDKFLNHYPEDGGCDEGSSYWDRAGGALFDCLELLHTASQSAFTVFNNPLVKNMGSYLHKSQINKNYFINFADGAVRVRISPALVYKYGKRTSNTSLQAMGAAAAWEQNIFEGKIQGNLYRQMETMFIADELLAADTSYTSPGDFFLPQLQVFGAREKPGTDSGLFVAAKGGHNNESHNHNDIGNFIVYHNSQPVLIDVGVGTYTAKTFSPQRYDIWNMQSAYHNTPTINGQMQKAGREYAAAGIKYKAEGNSIMFSMDITGAYPKDAGIQQWNREIVLDKNKSFLQVTDNYTLESVKGETFITLMTPCTVKTDKGKLLLSSENNSISISFDKNKIRPEIETIAMEDVRLKQAWGNQLYRIKLYLKNVKKKGKITCLIKSEI